MNKKINLCFGLFLLVLLGLSMVFAGVTSSYDYTHPLKVYPGEEKKVSISYQNIGNDNELGIVAEILEGGEFARLDSENHVVPANSVSPIEIEFKIPKSYEIGEEHLFRIKFSEVPSGEGEGMVTLGLSSTMGFNVEIVEKPEGVDEGISVWYFVIGILVLLVIILIVWKKKKNKAVEPVIK
jgi:LPXTG-motif cell wall-anchored protein